VLPVALFSLALQLASVGEAPLASELDRIEQGYAIQPVQRWTAAAEALIERAPTSQTAGRALVWLGALALRARQLTLADTRFAEARRRFPHGGLAALAARGRGDVAMASGHWRDAIARYDEAMPDADPVVAAELTEKRVLAAREQHRVYAEIVAWIAVALCALGIATPLRRLRWTLPPEARFLAPVYALLIGAAWTRDPHVAQAMLWIALGSLLLATLRRERSARARSRVDSALLILASAALVYIGVRRADVLDPLTETLRMSAGR
jgi:hypothetical protein